MLDLLLSGHSNLTALSFASGTITGPFTVQTKNQGTNLTLHSTALAINCSTNMTCADDGTTLTLTSTGGGGSTPTGTGFVHVTSAVQDGTARAVDVSSADITGNMGVSHLNSGTSASSTTFWRGDATWATPAGAGTVTQVTSGNFSPLFTVGVATNTSTPAFTFTASTAAANTVFGNFTGSPAAPTFTAAPTFSAANLTSFPTFNQNTTGTAAALTSTPTNCGAGIAAIGILANGNATGCFTPPAGTVTSVATTSPITGGTFSTTGTIACATCVTSTSPGLGLAHFPGSSQNVTSSLAVQADVTNGYVDLSSAQASIAGTKTFTGIINHTNTLTQTGNITVGNENAVVWVDGPKYSTIELALLDAQCSTQCQINLPSTFAETVTATITLGNGTTSFVHLHGMPGAHIACNITGGTTPCFIVSNGSGISGELTGTTSGGGALGFNFTYPSTFNGTAIITTNAATTNGNGYIDLEKFFVYGNASATVATAVVNIENILGQAVLRDFYVANFANTVGVRIATSTGGTGNTGTGPLVVDNVWADGFGNAGAKPCLITTNNSKTMLPIDWVGGVCAHAGNGLNLFEVNGNGNALGATSGISIRTYLENVTAGNVNIGLRLRDVVGVDFSGTVCVLASASDTCIDISESSANLTAGIHGGPVWKSSPSNTATLLNNHITGETNASAVQSFYNYGGESGTSAQPFIVSNNQVTFKDGANNNLFNISNGLQSAVTIASRADSQGTMGYGCGLTAEQVCLWGLFNHSNAILWGEGNDGSGDFILSDRNNIKTRMLWTPQAIVGASGILRLANTEILAAWRNNANSADVTISKLASDIIAISSGIATGASPPACTAGTAGLWCGGEGTAPTNVASTATIYPSSTTHEYMAATNGASTASPGMMVRVQPSPINNTAKTAAVTTATLCASAAGACNTAGQYRLTYNVWGSGTACATVTAGSLVLNFTWTDENAVTHTTINAPMWDQKTSAMTAGQVNFNTALGAEGGSGSFIISTNGTIIQYATTYTACTSGTGTYNLRIAAERLQ